jgi:hypothetical protein
MSEQSTLSHMGTLNMFLDIKMYTLCIHIHFARSLGHNIIS